MPAVYDWVEVALAVLLMLATILSGAVAPWSPGWMTFWLVQCASVALLRWTIWGTVVLHGLLTSVHLFLPYATMGTGVYASLVLILGLGLRRADRARWVALVWFGTVVVGATWRGLRPGDALVYTAMWVILYAMAWLFGSAFSALRHHHDVVRENTLLLERERLARELHDTVSTRSPSPACAPPTRSPPPRAGSKPWMMSPITVARPPSNSAN